MNCQSADGWPHLAEIVAPALAFLKINQEVFSKEL